MNLLWGRLPSKQSRHHEGSFIRRKQGTTHNESRTNSVGQRVVLTTRLADRLDTSHEVTVPHDRTIQVSHPSVASKDKSKGKGTKKEQNCYKR